MGIHSCSICERYHLTFPIEGSQSKNIICIGNKFVNLLVNLDGMCSDKGFKLLRGYIFFKSVRVYLETVGIGRSVCLYLLVWGEVGVLCLREAFGQAEALAQKAKVAHRFVYQQRVPGGVSHIWKVVHPHDTVIAAEETPGVEDINPDRIRYELTPDGKIAHLLKHW